MVYLFGCCFVLMNHKQNIFKIVQNVTKKEKKKKYNTSKSNLTSIDKTVPWSRQTQTRSNFKKSVALYG